ncbi:MAG: DUF4197 domain-containing protein [Candidatus Mcinerneyibacterium aminivorans]|uniref:DUF4197 domain-containing protein n=1 Tax=Candidatus Mcinerneyibacterium aminivorans TaxID=2703815 RepID=A0A5D0MI13_9BACT|nr:MAG: DUF4197 domain-containing protein [Candidatus Mcinerneyibacterium aminivorans]
MKNKYFSLAALLLIIFIFTTISIGDGLMDFFEDLTGTNKNSNLSEKTVARGLKEALEVGTQRTIKRIAKKNGYFKNTKIKIPLPEKLKKTEKTLRPIGYGEDFDKFVLSMNRAAEKAAPRAADIFVKSLKKMTIKNAVDILEGNDNAATMYFKETSYTELYSVFIPVVKKSINKTGVGVHYKKIKNKAETVPFLNNYFVDLDDYVTKKALEGLFVILAEEEKAIRDNPAKRTTELLKKLFE